MEIARIVARCLWEESRLLQTAATAAQVRPGKKHSATEDVLPFCVQRCACSYMVVRVYTALQVEVGVNGVFGVFKFYTMKKTFFFS